MSTELTITAVGVDRPGIVAALTGALLPIGANLEDCRAALLRGSFAMVMAVQVPSGVDREAARAALAPVAGEMGLEVWVGETAGDIRPAEGERCVVSVYGADHPGIVHAVSRALADADVNILDLSSRVVGDPPVYVLGLEVRLPRGLSVQALESRLRPAADAQHVELHIERESDDVL
jgi:glycine cleavage system transcriptional repressor